MLLLKARLALELPPINKALSRAAEGLPHPVRPIARHIFEAGGKRLRPLLTILMARLLGYDKKDIYDLAVTMEMLHAATLLHDDVLDNADTRRGKPAAHTIFNATSTILAGDAMLAHANALVAQCGDPRLCLCFSEATSRTAAGEILEIAAQHQVETTAEEYEEIIRGKTAWLIRARASWAPCAPVPTMPWWKPPPRMARTSAWPSRSWTTPWTSPPRASRANLRAATCARAS